MTGNTANDKQKAAKRACTTCRQSKIRCNSADTFPAPCSNCLKFKKECRSDASFKRTPVRGRLEEVTRQLDRIKRAQSYRDEDPLSPSSPSLTSGAHLGTPNSAGQDGLPSQPDTASAFCLNQLDDEASQVSAQTLESYYLSNLEIAKLFRDFTSLYLPHFPILDTRMSINVLHSTDALLFWTIILISSRHTEVLIEPYKNLLSKQLVEPVRSLYTIHALLLFCLWPLPVRKQILDSSWNYCGVAVNAAIRMGLHQSEATFEYDFSQFSAQDIEIRRMTWLGCFIISTYLSSDLGLPNTIGPAMDLEAYAKPSPVHNSADPLSIQFEIERHVARFSVTLSQRSGIHTRSSLIQMFDRDLKSLGEEVLALSNQRLEILFLGAKLSLYSFSILGETAASTEVQHIDSSMRSIWYLGVETASRLAYLYSTISTADSAPTTLDPYPPSPHYSYPKHNFWILLCSGYYLLKFLSVNTSVTPTEAEIARNSIRLVYSTMQSWSRHSIDEAARLARIISLLANAELQGTLADFKRINRRPPLSIVSDVMEITSWLRAKLKAEGKANPAPAGTGMGESKVVQAQPENAVMEPVLLDDEALWEGLDEWLRLEGDMGSFLLPYSEGGLL